MSSVNAKVVPFHEALTFTRASTKWVFDGTGTLVEVPVDQPAYDHDPVTGEALGVLIEPGATNLLEWSEVFTNWTTNGDLTSGSDLSSPTGFSYAITSNDGSDWCGLRSNAQGVTSNTTSLKAVLKAGSESLVTLTHAGTSYGVSFLDRSAVFDLSSGAVHRQVSSGLADIKSLGGGWHECTVTITTDTTSSARNFDVFLGDGEGVASPVGSSIDVSYCQLETGPVATSYIPTAGAAVTRAEDTVSRTLGAEFNGSSWTVLMGFRYDFSVPGGTYGRGSGFLFHFGPQAAGTYGDQLVAGVYVDSLSLRYHVSGENVGGLVTSFGLPKGESVLLAVSFESGVGYKIAINGASETFDIPGLPTLPSSWGDMGLSTAYNQSVFHGHKKDFRYYPYAMTAAELEALTTL